MSLNGSYQVAISFKNTPTLAGGVAKATETVPAADFATVALVDGTAAGQAQKIWSYTETISAAKDWDLTSLAATFGTVVLSKAKVIYVRNDSAANPLKIGPATSNGFSGYLGGTTPTVTIDAGGEFFIASPNTGWTVDATHKLFHLDPNSLSVKYSILIIGY